MIEKQAHDNHRKGSTQLPHINTKAKIQFTKLKMHDFCVDTEMNIDGHNICPKRIERSFFVVVV